MALLGLCSISAPDVKFKADSTVVLYWNLARGDSLEVRSHDSSLS